MDRRAIACFDLAPADVEPANDDVLQQVLDGPRSCQVRGLTTTVWREPRNDTPRSRP
jgi:hypothetical protein